MNRHCRGCIGRTGWTDVAEADHDIFGIETAADKENGPHADDIP